MQADVIITTFNSENFISKTLESILNQTYADLKIYINDDASTDDTVTIIKEYANRWPDKIFLSVNPSNVGTTINSQRALNRTKGDVIFLCGHDDIFEIDKVAKCIGAFNSNPSASVVYHDCLVVGKDRTFLFSETHGPRAGHARKYLIYGCFSTACSVALRGSDARAIGFKDVGACSDWLLFYEVAKRGEIAFINEVLGKYIRHATNITKRSLRKTDFSSLRASIFILEKYPEDIYYNLINLNWSLFKILFYYKRGIIFSLFAPIFTIFWLILIKLGRKKID